MLGFADFWTALAYLLCIGSTILCVVYGLIHWNDEEVIQPPQHPADENLDFEDTI